MVGRSLGLADTAPVVIRDVSRFAGERTIDCADEGSDGETEKDREAPRELLVGADVRVGDHLVTVVSAHPPHAAAQSDKERAWRVRDKLRTYAALERFVTPLERVVVGMDANAWVDYMLFEQTPRDDGSEQANVTRFFYETPPRHGLRNALHLWFNDHPDARADVLSRRPH